MNKKAQELFVRDIERHPVIKALMRQIRSGAEYLAVKNARGSLTGCISALAYLERENHPVLVVAPNPQRAIEIFEDASFLLDNHKKGDQQRVLLFEELNLLNQDFLTLSELETIFYRYRVLEQLIIDSPVLVIASRAALGTPLVAPSRYREHMVRVKPGDSLEKNRFLKNLFGMGYRLVSRVREIGQVAGRGGIIDVFPPGRKRPVRIDLFGDQVESLREFDPETQRTLALTDILIISPCFEAELLRDQDPESLFDFDGELRDLSTLSDEHLRFREFSLKEKDEFLARGYSYFDKAGIWDYLSEGSYVIIDAPGLTLSREIASKLPQNQGGDGAMLPEHSGLVHDVEAILKGLNVFPRLEFLSSLCPDSTDLSKVFWMNARPVSIAAGSFDRRLEQYIEKYSASGVKNKNRLFIVTRSSERISEILVSDHPEVMVLHGDLSQGFDLTPDGPVVISDAELFPARQKGFLRARGKTKAFTREDLREVRIGDYLVHVHFGIGVFRGMVQQKGPEGSLRDYVLLEYAKNDKLYVPVEHIDHLFRYTSAEGAAPVINRLGSTDWDRLKRKVKKTMVRIAEDLLKLYRVRMEVTGHQFSPDTVWQKEVEDRFEFQETAGQLRSLDELKRDMESPRPMDRLICAEVGYGKTELAVRAALKCVLDGMQAVMLVPTTILAQQHFLTFQKRLGELPIKIAILSRFQSRKEQKETLAALAKGKVDILIGTHRVLSKDVQFSNLGLLIVDEEQKFGVRHKEKIKFLKNSIDVLTLTATPIPRTLYMSLIGLKDISVIDSPPPERFPIKTFVKRLSPLVIKNAIQAEIARGGQVYYLHNRVETIDACLRRIQNLVPNARVVAAHGRMEESALERVMMEFMSGEHDVLVCTTIIENGLDIPRVNTLIVEDAQNFGLAQLHQVRGRVGRSDVQAYAYFLFPPGKTLSGLAAKRLEALASFSHLGAGYEIALRDLELRGAGNILGPEQHGFVNQLGFDLYAKVLNETIHEVRSGSIDYDNIGTAGHVECVLRLPVDARIPPSYLLDQTERFAIYRRLGSISEPEVLDEIRLEMIDRFGPLPKQVENLLQLLSLRIRAMACGVESIVLDKPKGVIQVLFHHKMSLDERWKRIGDLVKKARLKPLPRGFQIPAQSDPEKVVNQVKYLIDQLENIGVSSAKSFKNKLVRVPEAE